jgi:SAM-dependent methyltransferase
MDASRSAIKRDHALTALVGAARKGPAVADSRNDGTGDTTGVDDTASATYSRRLESLEGARWKRLLDVQRPYRWNIRRHGLGRTLDVGAGLGRNLAALPPGSLGVDHNEESVRIARSRGFDVVTTDEFPERVATEPPFDGMLVAHVLEHMDEATADEILAGYLEHIRPAGKIMLICPQERGYASDPTHVRFVDLDGLKRHALRHGLEVLSATSFPFPRPAGKVFRYNEFVLVARKPA